MPKLCELVQELKPILVIIDTLFKFVRVSDEKAYAEVCRAIEATSNSRQGIGRARDACPSLRESRTA